VEDLVQLVGKVWKTWCKWVCVGVCVCGCVCGCVWWWVLDRLLVR